MSAVDGSRSGHRLATRPSEAHMKYLHTMVRVTDIDASLRFYRDALGLKELSRRACRAGRYRRLRVAAPGDASAEVELTHNWDRESYGGGATVGHVAYAVIAQALAGGVDVLHGVGQVPEVAPAAVALRVPV